MTLILKPKFMDTNYAYPVLKYWLDQEAPRNIKELFSKMEDNETVPWEDRVTVYGSKYYHSKITSWKAVPSAPQEIKDEVEWYNKFVIKDNLEIIADHDNSQ